MIMNFYFNTNKYVFDYCICKITFCILEASLQLQRLYNKNSNEK